MCRFTYLLSLLFIWPFFTAGQSYNKNDSAFVFTLIAKAENFFTTSKHDSALYYCNKAEEYSRQKQFKRGLAYALIETTDVLIDKDALDKAGDIPSRVKQLAQQLNDSLIKNIAIMQQAQILMYSNRTDAAIALFEECTRNYFVNHPSRYAALAYNDMGYAYGVKEVLDKKAASLLKALEIYETADPENYSELGVTLNNLSIVHYSLGDKPQAIVYAKRSIAYREKAGEIASLSLGCCNLSQLLLGINDAEALQYQALCVKYAEQSGDEMRILHAYVTSSMVAGTQQKFSLAMECERKAIQLLEKNKKDPVMLARRYISLGINSTKLQEDSAVTAAYFKTGVELSAAVFNKQNLKDAYAEMAVFYKKHNDFAKAYECYQKHILYRDSIVSSTTQGNIAELEKKYQAEKKDREIALLTANQKINALQIEKQQALIEGNRRETREKENQIALLSKQRELQEYQLRQQQQELEKQMLQSKNKEQQLQLTEKEKQLRDEMLSASSLQKKMLLVGLATLIVLGVVLFSRYRIKQRLKEKEALLSVRNNIARDLHDDIGATLSNINILNELAKRSAADPQKLHEYLSKSAEDIQQVSESIGDIVWNVNPRFDSFENLLVRMKRYAADMMDGKNIQYEMNFPADTTSLVLNMEQRRDLYMIMKEAVNNIVKYSGAGNAWIDLSFTKQQIALSIKDNGKGFDSGVSHTGNGLQNMKQRAAKWNGNLQVDSEKGKGTEVKLNMPMAMA